jgi:hypothetical protein
MMYKRYSGEFYDISGNVWRCDILQEAESAYEQIGELRFDDSPLEIEWQRRDKEKVICGSSATLKPLSPGDRTYADLYSIAPGLIRLDVYRGGSPYWSGCLDPEFYEEPYESTKGYIVSLTFSDFGILERLKYNMMGMRTLGEIIEDAVSRAKINVLGIDSSLVSTTFADGGSIAGEALAIRSENWIDEEGEASNMADVVEGVLQPLGIKLVQREGKVWLFDINGLYEKGESREIAWAGDTQTMGVDKVANNVKITFSPYSSAKLYDGGLTYGGKCSVNKTNLTGDDKNDGDYGDYFTYYPDYEPDVINHIVDYDMKDFTIFLSKDGNGLDSIGPGCMYFHILPLLGGASETTGVAYSFYTGGHGSLKSGYPKRKLNSSIPAPTDASQFRSVLKTKRMFVPALDTEARNEYLIRVVEEMMIDARYNPFNEAGKHNESGNDKKLKQYSSYVLIPARITLYDESGKALYHYKNKTIALTSAYGILRETIGEWVSGTDTGGDCFLEYYDKEDPNKNCGIAGWKANRPCIGRPDGGIDITGLESNGSTRKKFKSYESFQKLGDGQYLKYPPVGGYLEVEICAGAFGFRALPSIANPESWDNNGVRDIIRWMLYKAPEVNIVNNNVMHDDTELEDVEYSAYINVDAKDDISIDTVCGTAEALCPTAKGIYYRTDTHEQVQKLTRAGRTAHPEKLLIGTLYSQYASRKTTLSGEAAIDGGLSAYTESNQEGKKFMLMSDAQDIRMCSTKAEYCEIRPDEYDEKDE